jgi:hypothetical protein
VAQSGSAVAWATGRGDEKGIIGAWRSLVARLVWDQEAEGSNPSAPTILASEVTWATGRGFESRA